MVRWVDLSAHGLTLKVRQQDDLRWLVLESLPGAGAVPAELAARLGFAPRDGIYMREGAKITLGEVQKVFPQAGVCEFEVAELRASVAAPAAPEPPATTEIVVPPAPRIPPGGWLSSLRSMSPRSSVPIDKVPWVKIDSDKWSDGNRILDTPALAALAERRMDVLEGQVVREQLPGPGQQVSPSPAAEDQAILSAATLSLARFKQQAQAYHDGSCWHAVLDGRSLFMPPDLGAQSVRKRPETILTEAHRAQVQWVVERSPYACDSLASLASYPALAYPGSLARGRRAEMNVMRLLGTLGIVEGLLEDKGGRCVLHNDPYMDLVIKRDGSTKPETLYLTHYFERDGDRVMDAQMVFKIERGRLWFKETATLATRGGELRGPDREFANLFSQNLLRQGFERAEVEWLRDARPWPEDERPRPALRPRSPRLR